MLGVDTRSNQELTIKVMGFHIKCNGTKYAQLNPSSPNIATTETTIPVNLGMLSILSSQSKFGVGGNITIGTNPGVNEWGMALKAPLPFWFKSHARCKLRLSGYVQEEIQISIFFFFFIFF